MKTMEKMKKVTVILVAILFLLTVVFAMSTLTGKSAAYAAEDSKTQELFLAPLQYVYYPALSEDIPERYEVTGVDLSAMQDANEQWTDEWTEEKRNNLKIAIPARFDDQVHGELPIMGITANAFREDANYNVDLDFKALDLKNTVDFRFINDHAFYRSSLAGELYLPATTATVDASAFASTKITSIVFDDRIGTVMIGETPFRDLNLDHQDIIIPEGLRSVRSDGSLLYFNLFVGIKGIRSFSVKGENEMFYTSDGVLYAKDTAADKTYLICYPSAKEGETYSVTAGVTDIVNRAFNGFPTDHLKLLILPDTITSISSYAFGSTNINVFLTPTPALRPHKAYAFYSFNGNVILPDKDAYTAAMAEGGVLHSITGLNENNVLYLSSLSASLKENAAIDTSFDAEAVKELLQVTALTNGASPVTVPLSDRFDFDVALPANGLAAGENEINVSFRSLSATVIVPVSKQTQTAPAAPAISGTPTADSVILTAIEGAEYSKDNGATWQDSPIFNNLMPNTEYAFVARIKETDTAHASAISPVLTLRTDKPTPAAPAAPAINGTPTADSVTLTAIEGAEYSKDNGATWQDSPIFNNLTPNTEYAFVARIKETDTDYASAISPVLTIKTDKATPAAPTISGTPTADSVTLTAIEGAEYSKDNGKTWQDSPTFTGLTPNTEYTFIARIKATDTAYASATSAILTIKTAVPNDEGGLSGGAIAGIVIGSLVLAGIAGFAIFWFAIKKKKFADLITVFRKK